MNRRTFLRVATLALVPAPWSIRRTAMPAYTLARPVRRYPGPVRSCGRDAVSKPGRWAG